MKKLFIANWKMALTHNESCTWIDQHLSTLQNEISHAMHELVICPSFTVLPYAVARFPEYSWGAQDCSFAQQGAYTGDISTKSLEQLDIDYTIIGHSERRIYHGETDEQIAQKAALLLKSSIAPIICVGEHQKDSNIESIFAKQLKLILPLYNDTTPLTIAYEPGWAIGTGESIAPSELALRVGSLKNLCGSRPVQILYGGSVQPEIAARLITEVDGFLIGSASINSESLKKIILSC